MKIRMEGNSVRLRLRRSEVEALAREGQVVQQVTFPQGDWHYTLQLDASRTHPDAILATGGITLMLPQAWGRAWAVNETIGFSHSLALPGGGTLDLLVEKDFVCLDRDLEGQEDQYPHPKSDPPNC